MRTGRVQGPSTSLRTKSPLQSGLCLQQRSWTALSHSTDCISRTRPLLDSLSMPIAFSKRFMFTEWQEYAHIFFTFDQFTLLQVPEMCEFTSLVVQTWAKEPAYLCSHTARMHAHIHPTHDRACAENICKRGVASLTPLISAATSTLPPLEWSSLLLC